MATIINNTSPTPESGADNGSGGGSGMLIGAIVLVLILIIFFVYGLPAIRGNGGSNEGSTINVPDKVQVDVNSGDSGSGTAQ